MEEKSCPYVKGCPVYQHFRTKSVKDVFTTIYCQGNFANCARKKLKDNGDPVPDKLLPNGQYAP